MSATSSNNYWYNQRQRVTKNGKTSDTTRYNEWQLMTTSGTYNENEWKQIREIRASKREWFWF